MWLTFLTGYGISVFQDKLLMTVIFCSAVYKCSRTTDLCPGVVHDPEEVSAISLGHRPGHR